MLKKVVKSKKALKGEITIPPDKSISHRAVMFSSIAKGECLIKNFSNGADCHSTLNLFKQLGVDIQFIDEKILKIKASGNLSLNNPHPNPLPRRGNNSNIYHCGNSGTTMRLVSGILAGENFNSVLVGDESLSKRPMKRIIEPLSLMGAEIESTEGHAPLTIKGRKLRGISYSSKLASAQVKSSILLAALKAEGKTVYTEPYVSRDHTERLFKYMGADIIVDGVNITLNPSVLDAKDIDIVGDISSAAFFIVAGLIVKDSDFIVKNVGLNPTRTGILEIIQRMGAKIEILDKYEKSGEPCADIRVQYTDSLKACTIEGSDIPKLIDELPVIAVLASQANGETVVKNAEDLRNKEADRIKCLVTELKKIGVDIEETADGFKVRGKSKLSGDSLLETYHDHRLAMSFYIAGLICEKPIGINGFEWTKISFPEFEDLMQCLI